MGIRADEEFRSAIMTTQRDEVSDVRDWTLLVYMVSDDSAGPARPEKATATSLVNLDLIADMELAAINKAAAKHQGAMHVAIQVDFLNRQGTFRWMDGVEQPPLAESVSIDPEVFSRFLQWGMESCRARRYSLLFWGHSSGPSGLFSDQVPSYAFSRRLAQTLTLPAIGKSLETAKGWRHYGSNGNHAKTNGSKGSPIEILIFKDCFQSILEAAFEFGRIDDEYTERASFMISSQGLVPVAAEGDSFEPPKELPPWPHEELFKCLEGGAKTETVAVNLVDSLGKFYSEKNNRGGHLEVPFSLLRLDKVQDLVSPLRTLKEHLYRALNSPGASDDIYDALRFAFRGSVDGDPMLMDLRSLCDHLVVLGGDEVTSAAAALAQAVDRTPDGIVSAHRPVSSPFHGLSLYYYPASPDQRAGSAIGQVFLPAYRVLRLSQATEWDKVALADTPSVAAQRRLL
jgi:hypothetical protein